MQPLSSTNHLPFVCQTPAKIIAVIDLSFSSLKAILFFLSALLWVFGKDFLMREMERQGVYEDDPDTKAIVTMFGTASTEMILATFGTLIFCEIITIWAAIQLLGATRNSVNAAQAVKKVRIYKITSIILLVLAIFGVIGGMGSLDPTTLGLNVAFTIFRGGALLVSSLYLKELKSPRDEVYEVNYDGQNGYKGQV